MELFYLFVKSSVESLTPSLPTDWTKVPYEGVDFRGSDIGFELMDDAESCQKTCTLDANCQFYTYVNDEFFNPVYRYIFFILVCKLLRISGNTQRLSEVSKFYFRNVFCCRPSL